VPLPPIAALFCTLSLSSPLALAGGPAGLAAAVDGPAWPSFRGAAGAGRVPTPHPAQWSPDENLAWSVEVPGGGWSSPLIAGDRVFLTTAVQGDGRRPVGFAAGVRAPETRGAGAAAPTAAVTFRVEARALGDGALLWGRDVATRVPPRGVHPSNSFATETPATDGERIVAAFGAIGLVVCLSVDGEVLWTYDSAVHPTTADFGPGSSVALASDIEPALAYVQSDNEAASSLTALRLADGAVAWRRERPQGTSWSSPILWRSSAGVSLVVAGPDAVTGYDPASGDVRWRVEEIGGTFSASPTAAGERLVFGNSAQQRRGPLAVLCAGCAGSFPLRQARPAEGQESANVASPVLWTVERAGPSFGSPIAVGELVFVVDGQGIATCRELATGATLWSERLPEAFNVVASPWTDGERVFVLAEGGTTFVLAAAREYRLLARNTLPGTYWATPSAADGALLLRSADRLHCVRKSAPAD